MRVIRIRDRGLFVDEASNSMAAEIANHPKPTPLRSMPHSTADILHRSARPCLRQTVLERELSGTKQSARLRRDLANRETGTSIRPVAIELCRHIDVDQVARAQHYVRRRDAVSELIVHADTGGSQESIGKLRPLTARRSGPSCRGSG